MTFLKRSLTLIGLLLVLYIVNYWRLSVLPPAKIDYVAAIEANTLHEFGGNTFTPTKYDMNTYWTRLSDDPFMGIHYISLLRMFGPFNPDKPTGFTEYNRKIVAYFYSSPKPVGGYHWHYHKNVCYLEGLVGTTEHSPFWCVTHGYVWFPINRWMLHVWVVPNPNGLNDLWNPYLQ